MSTGNNRKSYKIGFGSLKCFNRFCFFKLTFKIFRVLAVFEVGIQFQRKEVHFLTYLVLEAEAVQHKVVEKKVSHYRSTKREVVNKNTSKQKNILQ